MILLDATPEVDYAHWSRFPHFDRYEASFAANEITKYNFDPESPYVFMRWKEQFLVTDHNKTSVEGASFSG